MMPAMIALLTGVVLGMRFKFLVLIPAVMLATAWAVTIGIAHSDGVPSIALSTVAVCACLQLGYAGGLLMYQGAAVIRAARIRKALPGARRAVSRHAH